MLYEMNIRELGHDLDENERKILLKVLNFLTENALHIVEEVGNILEQTDYWESNDFHLHRAWSRDTRLFDALRCYMEKPETIETIREGETYRLRLPSWERKTYNVDWVERYKEKMNRWIEIMNISIKHGYTFSQQHVDIDDEIKECKRLRLL